MNPHLTANPVTSTDSWFACPQTNPGTDVRLLLFPYAGGGPEVFGKWSAELPNDVQGCAIHYPGRGSRHNETPFNRLIPLVKALARAIQPFVDKPFAFLGHSLGGLVAFELAQHLHQNNLPQPSILFISACGAPHLHAVHQPIHTLPDAEFIDALQKFKGIPSDLLQLPEAMEFLLPALRADFEAFESYHYTSSKIPLSCPIVAFGGLDDPRVSREQLQSWSLHTNSTFKSQYFSGDHFFINTAREAIIESIAREIDAFCK